MTVHVLKCDPEYFEAVESGKKPFEVRRDDREPPFETGDIVALVHGPGIRYGERLVKRIGYVARGGRIPEGFCVFALVPAKVDDGIRVEMATGETVVSK